MSISYPRIPYAPETVIVTPIVDGLFNVTFSIVLFHCHKCPEIWFGSVTVCARVEAQHGTGFKTHQELHSFVLFTKSQFGSSIHIFTLQGCHNIILALHILLVH